MNEQDIPIEISASKLLDWLESRKIVGKNWQNQVRDIRNKISNALNDMPVHEDLVKLLSGSYINYFHCLQIVEILKTTEADTKSLFGRYGSQRMNDWLNIVRLYEKDSVYLADCGQILQRQNVEVPGLRKQRNKIGQTIDETHQRIKDLAKSEEHLLSERLVICQQLGIKGVSLKEEFTERIKELPKFYEEIVKILPKLKKAIEYYIDFSGNPEFLPLLKHLLEHGNTTVYHYIYNEPPLSVEEPVFVIDLAEDDVVQSFDVEKGQIDFGDYPAEVELDDYRAGINFGDESTFSNNDDIDWGDVNVHELSSIEDVPLEESGIEVSASGNDGGFANGDKALTILDNPSHRDLFTDEIYELEAFLQMRIHEMKSDQANSFIFTIIEKNNKYDADTVADMLKDVKNVIETISNETLEHLYRLKHSPKYAKILAAKLKQQLITVDKVRATREILKEKIVTLNAEKENIRPIITKLIVNTKQLTKQIENDISKRYKGRPVVLYGSVDADPLD